MARPGNRPPAIIWRMRTIHKEFSRDRALAMAERNTGLPVLRVYAGLWGAADREGRFPWLMDELQRCILPWDSDRWPIEKVLDVLIEGGWLVRYEADGLSWGWIPRLGEFQVFNAKEPMSSWPAPPKEVVRAWACVHRPASVDTGESQECGTRGDASSDTGLSPMLARVDTGLHVSARVDTCRSALSILDLKKEGGTRAHARDNERASSPGDFPPPGPSGPQESGSEPPPPLQAAPARRRRGGAATPRDPLDEPATADQLALLAEMAVERGTSLTAQATAAGIKGAVLKRHVTGLKTRLKAIPRPDSCKVVDGKPVIWGDVKALLDANEPGRVAELLSALPASRHRTELWDRVRRHCNSLIPRDIDLGAIEVLDLNPSRDLPEVWAVIQRMLSGDRSMLPQPEPEDEAWRLFAPNIPQLSMAITNRGNGSTDVLRERLQAALDARDAVAGRALMAEIGFEGVPS